MGELSNLLHLCYISDHVFDTSCNNEDIFEGMVKPVVAGALNGINGTVFAYGQTSSGKQQALGGKDIGL